MRRFAGSAPADAAGQAAERVVLLAQARQGVLELRQLDLQLAVAALGALREDVEDHLGAIQDLEIGLAGDGVRLSRAQIAVENQGLGAEIDGLGHHVFELAGAHDEARICLIAQLDDAFDHVDAGGARQAF